MNIPFQSIHTSSELTANLVVIIAQYRECVIFCRRHDSCTMEFPCDFVASGEASADAAKRVIREKLGTDDFSLHPIGVFQTEQTGMIFFCRNSSAFLTFGKRNFHARIASG